MWSLKYDTNELTYETQSGTQPPGTRWQVPRRRGGWEGWTGSLGLQISLQMQTRMYWMDKHQEPTVSTGNYTQYPVINHKGKNIKNRPGKILGTDTFPGVQTLVLEPHLSVPSKHRV